MYSAISTISFFTLPKLSNALSSAASLGVKVKRGGSDRRRTSAGWEGWRVRGVNGVCKEWVEEGRETWEVVGD